MAKRENLKDSSGERMDRSNVTEDKSDDVMQSMLNSVEKERKTMIELNEKLGKLETARSKTLTTEMQQLQIQFKESKTKTKTEIDKQIEEMKKLYINPEQLGLDAELKQMKVDLGMKTTETDRLKEQNQTFEEQMQKMNRKIEDLERSKSGLNDQVKRMEEAYEKIKNEHTEALTKQKQAEGECYLLKAEKIYLENTFESEKLELSKTLFTLKTAQESKEKANKDKLTENMERLETEYSSNLEKSNKDMEIVYKRKLDKEVSKMKQTHEEERKQWEKEQDVLQQQNKKQEKTFQLLREKHDALSRQISYYNTLLKQKIETYSSEQQKGYTKETEEFSMERSKVENKSVINMVSSGSDKMSKLLSIKEVDDAGNFLVIHNSSKSEIDLSKYLIERTHSGGSSSFTVPEGIKISAGKDLKIFSKLAPGKKGPGDIVATFTTWGTGNGTIKVNDANKVDIASYPIG